MARLTKSDIDQKLIAGESLAWQDANKKNCSLVLGDIKERRLFTFLREARIRRPAGLQLQGNTNTWQTRSTGIDLARTKTDSVS